MAKCVGHATSRVIGVSSNLKHDHQVLYSGFFMSADVLLNLSSTTRNVKVTKKNTRKHHKGQESQEVSPFPTGDHKKKVSMIKKYHNHT